MNSFIRSVSIAVALACATSALGNDVAKPSSDPVLDRPTLHSLGAYWIIKGDKNANAAVRVDYRRRGESDWRQGPSMFRVEKGAHKPKENESLLKIADDETLLAGSVLLLDPDTSYELKLTLADPDGGDKSTKTLEARTLKEPVAPDGPIRYVVPG